MPDFILSNHKLHYQNTVEALVQQTLSLGLGKIADNGALCVNTGKFTGRSPENKFFIKESLTCVDQCNEKYYTDFNKSECIPCSNKS
mgnify:CR=1 FL=1